MDFSVVIPMYNSEKTIIDALDSVRCQTNTELIREIIVVDDGSKDCSFSCVRDYMQQYPQLPIKIVQQENRGASAARNTGMRLAKAEWIAFLDADDEWLPQKMMRQAEVLAENPQIDLLGAGADEYPLRILFKKINTLYKVSLRDLTIKSFPVTPSIVMRRKIFEEIGGFDESRRYMEDAQYLLRISRRYGYYYLPEHLVQIGHGKRAYGDSGLSGNLKAMQQGYVENLRELRRDRVVSLHSYLALRVFYTLKYLRRIVISKYA